MFSFNLKRVCLFKVSQRYALDKEVQSNITKPRFNIEMPTEVSPQSIRGLTSLNLLS